MKYQRLAVALCALGLLSISHVALAHEFIVKPEATNVAKGQQVSLQAQAAHVFMVSEEAEPVETVKITLLQGTASTPVSLEKNDALNALTGNVTLADSTPAMLVGHRLPQLWSDTTTGVLEGDRAALEAQGKKVLHVGKYEKFAKTMVNTGKDDTLYKKTLGQTLEIVLLDNPALLKAGDKVRCQVLLHGKPVAAPVGVTYDGYSKEEDTYAAKTTSDAKGMATFTVTKPGLWMIRTEATEALTDGSADKHNMRSTYVFPVR